MNEEIIAQSKAIEEVAKTSGKGIDAVKKFCNFIAEYTSGSIREACGIFEDKLKYARWENQARLMRKAKEFLKKNGLDAPNKALPFKLAVPLLQAATLEDNDYLQDMWAKLLVNSTSQNSNFDLQRVYIDILERLSPFDAEILEKIYSIPYKTVLHKQIVTSALPDSVEVPKKELGKAAEPDDSIKISLLNLDRLNCIFIAKSMGGGQLFGIVHQTLLGNNFIEACKIKP